MRYTIKNKSGEYVHIGCYGGERSPFYTRDERDSVVFATKVTAEKFMAGKGIIGTIVPRLVKDK